MVGVDAAELEQSRFAESDDLRTDAALRFAVAYFNKVAETEIDFPRVSAGVAA